MYLLDGKTKKSALLRAFESYDSEVSDNIWHKVVFTPAKISFYWRVLSCFISVQLKLYCDGNPRIRLQSFSKQKQIIVGITERFILQQEMSLNLSGGLFSVDHSLSFRLLKRHFDHLLVSRLNIRRGDFVVFSGNSERESSGLNNQHK